MHVCWPTASDTALTTRRNPPAAVRALRQGARGCLATLLVAAGLLAMAPAQAEGIYSCEDARGRKLTADRPITDCLDREQRVLRGSGGERGRIGPSLSEKDSYLQEQRQRAAAQQRRQALDAQRREQALLQRYPRQELHDTEQRQALAALSERITIAVQRMDVLRVERGIQSQEMEFYIRDATLAPGTLQRLVADTDGMLYQQMRYLQGLQRERMDLLQRFSAEQQVLQRYWQQTEEDERNGAARP